MNGILNVRLIVGRGIDGEVSSLYETKNDAIFLSYPGPVQDSLRPKAEILKGPFTSKYYLNNI